ncbi:Hypothetical protein NTJ_03873 [Nesidiocoris tenuis]|uniref:Actin interacting protein 3-like C-terminal domain-containing protein n=1 Tax=Nesidiocoris tenuis TaxID=355587 RepID=A0ABN7AJL2_9HEMI|nr:Hypothetical protein NTJ_03873 [Nesidiocoris tenuis]
MITTSKFETQNMMKELVHGINTKIDSCLAKYDALAARVDQIQMDVEAIKGENLAGRVAVLESPGVRAGQAAVPLDLEKQFAELEERRKRAANVIIFNYPEPQASDVVQAINHDLVSIKSSLDQLAPDLSALALRVARLGSADAKKPRPIKVTFDAPATATRVLSLNRSRQPPLFAASSDRTLAQRSYLNELRNELKTRTDLGEPHLTIKYVSGIPTIVALKGQGTVRYPKNGPAPPPIPAKRLLSKCQGPEHETFSTSPSGAPHHSRHLIYIRNMAIT